MTVRQELSVPGETFFLAQPGGVPPAPWPADEGETLQEEFDMTQQQIPGPVPQNHLPMPTPTQFAGYEPKPSAGLSIAAMVLGILAILGSLIPLLNLFSMLLALIGGVLGIVSLVRRMGGKGMAIAGVILSALALIGAIIANLALGAALDSAADDLATAADSAAAPAAPAADPVASAPQLGGPSENPFADAPAEAPAPAQLAVGQAARTGDYTVTITQVNTNANDVVAAANMFNDAPTGQYVLVDVAATYNGGESGTPWIDLDWTFQGADARDYDSAYCALDNGEIDQPDLRRGGSAAYSICFDVPATAIEGGAIQAEEFLQDPQTWSLK